MGLLNTLQHFLTMNRYSSSEVVAMNLAIQRVERAQHICLLRTDYLEDK